MKGGFRAPKILPVVVGKIFLRWIFTKADLLFFIYRYVQLSIYYIIVIIQITISSICQGLIVDYCYLIGVYCKPVAY